MTHVRHALVFAANGVLWIALILLVVNVLHGTAYWVVGGGVVVLALASTTYLARRGMKAPVRRRAEPLRK